MSSDLYEAGYRDGRDNPFAPSLTSDYVGLDMHDRREYDSGVEDGRRERDRRYEEEERTYAAWWRGERL